MKTTQHDLEERLDILGLVTDAVLNQNNAELSKKLSYFSGTNIQWVLNMLADGFDSLQESLEVEYQSTMDY
jgi:hypothetical protein